MDRIKRDYKIFSDIKSENVKKGETDLAMVMMVLVIEELPATSEDLDEVEEIIEFIPDETQNTDFI